MKPTALLLCCILSACSTTTRVDKERGTVTSGYGQRTIVTLRPDKTVTVETLPINLLQSVVGGLTSGLLGWAAHKEPTP